MPEGQPAHWSYCQTASTSRGHLKSDFQFVCPSTPVCFINCIFQPVSMASTLLPPALPAYRFGLFHLLVSLRLEWCKRLFCSTPAVGISTFWVSCSYFFLINDLLFPLFLCCSFLHFTVVIPSICIILSFIFVCRIIRLRCDSWWFTSLNHSRRFVP
jgi:hypothetical protein